MAKSKLLKDLVNREIELDEALEKLMIYASDLKDECLYKWASSELRGYKEGDVLQPYRILNSGNILYNGINGRYICTGTPLDIWHIIKGIALKKYKVEDLKELSEEQKKEIQEKIDEIQEVRILFGIGTLIDAYKTDNLARDLTDFSEYVLESSDESINCSRIYIPISKGDISGILSSIRTKLIDILIEIDSKVENLDDLDISSISEKDKEGIRKQIKIIIMGKDNQVSIGDNSDNSNNVINIKRKKKFKVIAKITAIVGLIASIITINLAWNTEFVIGVRKFIIRLLA